nr:hypothetical protein [Tanacetum cinerariifolium]
MQTRSSSRLTRDQPSNLTSATNTTPKGRNHRVSKQKVENSNLEEHLPPVVTMADNRTMAELLRAPTEGYAEAIVVRPILAEQFELKHSLINMMTTDQFFGLEKDNPHDHIRWDSPPVARKRTPAFYYHAWDRYKDLLHGCPHHDFTELHQLNTFYNAAGGGNLLERSTQDVLKIIKNKSKVRNSRRKPITYQVKACDINSNSEIAKLTHAVNQGAHPYYQCLAAGGNTFSEFRDNIQGYVLAATVNYNQGNPGYHPQGVANQIRPPGSGSLPSNTVSNLKGELKAITTRCGLVTDGPTVPTPPKSITDVVEYTIKVPPPPVQKYKPPSQREFVVHKRDHLYPNIPYPSRMFKQK